MSDHPDQETIGKVGGHVVRHMIEEVEQEMADGKQVSAKPINENDAKALQNARKENHRSGKQT